ncbi:MAG: hypothetical protein WKG00_18165 [Polyangiaceae bacterium]
MAGVAHDLQRVIASDRTPSNAGRAQVVPGDALAGGVGEVQVAALDTGALQRGEQRVGQRRVLRQPWSDLATPAGGLTEGGEERKQPGLDGHRARALRLRRLRGAVALLGPVDAHAAGLQIDVGPLERPQLAGPRVEVHLQRQGAAQLQRALAALEQAAHLGRVQPLLGLLGASVRSPHAGCRVDLADAQRAVLGVVGVREGFRHQPPGVDGGLPRQAPART